MGCAASTPTENTNTNTTQQSQTVGGSINTFAQTVVQNTTLLVNSAFTSQQQQQTAATVPAPAPAPSSPPQHVQRAQANPSQPIQAWTESNQNASTPVTTAPPIAQVAPLPVWTPAEVAAVVPVKPAPNIAPEAEPRSVAAPPPVVDQSAPEQAAAQPETAILPNTSSTVSSGDADSVEDSNPSESGSIRDHHHPLKYFDQRYKGSFQCNICRKSGSGPAYACDACGFDAHIECFTTALQAPSSGTIAAHPHMLSYYTKRYNDDFSCNICRQHGSGPAFACEKCGFDAHIECFNKGMSDLKSIESTVTTSSPVAAPPPATPANEPIKSGTIAAHPHSLSYYTKRYNGGFSCNICQQHGSGPAYACDRCGFDAHIACFEKALSGAAKPATVVSPVSQAAAATPAAAAALESNSTSNSPPNGLAKEGVIMEHMHPLSYFDKRYQGNFMCKICRTSGSGPAYACDECKFDTHVKCFTKANQILMADVPSYAKQPQPVGDGMEMFSNTGGDGMEMFGNIGDGDGGGGNGFDWGAPPSADTRAPPPPASSTGMEMFGGGGFFGGGGDGGGGGGMDGMGMNNLLMQLGGGPVAPTHSPIEPAKLGKSFSSPLHAHPVNYMECTWASSLMSTQNCFDCAICGNQGAGAVLWCGPCNFGAHPKCFFIDAFESPQSSTSKASAAGLELGTFHQPSPSQHLHKMQYLSWRRPWSCGECATPGDGNYFYCFECNYTVHDACFKAYDPNSKEKLNTEVRDLSLRARGTRWSSVHNHPLTYMPDQPPHISLQGRYRCRVCDTDGAGASWSCAVCALTEVPHCLHLHCFKDDGPGSDVYLVDMLAQLTMKKPVVANPAAIESFVSKEVLPVKGGGDGQARLTPAQLAACLAAFPYLKAGFTHPPLGVKAALIWNHMNAQDASHQYDVLYPIAKTFACDNDDNAKKPLSESLKVAVFFDLYKLQDWSVNNRMNTDMNVVVWRKIMDAHASGKGFGDLKSEGILVTPIDSMPGGDCAFITHRWNGVQGIGGMSISLFQTFTYHMAIASGYKPEVQSGGKGEMRPLYVWLDYLSVPQTSWNSSHSFSADELAVRQRLNSKYIQFIGLEFGNIAQKSAYFINYVPLSFEFNEDPASIGSGHKLKPVVDLLKSFDTLPNFYIQSKKFLTSAEQNWDPVDELEDWGVWQDRSYATRIWCVAEYSTVYLAGLGDRIKGAAQWYSVLLPIIAAKDSSVLSRFHTVRDSYYTSDCLERSTKHAFAAWQDFNPQVQRREDPFRPMKMSAGQICQHFLSVEGLLMALAPAIATVKSDVPLVTDTMYRGILRSAWDEVVATLPSDLQGMRNWILRQGRCGLDLPAILDDVNPQTGDLKSDFIRAFHKQGIFDRYISYLGQFIRQGFNSMLWIDTLLVWSAILQLPPPSDSRAVVDIDSILKPMPVESIPRGYRNAKYAYTWLNRTLDISERLITGYFMPSYSSNGWSGMVALTESIPFQFAGSKPITTSFVKYLTPSHDPQDNSLSSFSMLNPSSSSSSAPSGYQLLYKVRSSYSSSAKGVNQTHVILDGAVAVPRVSLCLPDRFELSSSNAHECVDLNGSKLGLLMFTTIYPLERELPAGLQCQPEGIPQPMWKISNHAKEFKTNVIVAHSNIK